LARLAQERAWRSWSGPRLWLDEFVAQFVVAPTADVPDFGLQCMPKLESLALLL